MREDQDLGNIVELGHVNLRVPDQVAATAFYVTGLGLTRDPYMMTGTDNMWVNAGRGQFHLPTGPAQVLPGVIGLVLPDPAAAARRLGLPRDGAVTEARCPWGNRIRLHAPDPARFGPVQLGLAYVEMVAPVGGAPAIARFYREILGAPAEVLHDAEGPCVRIPAGPHEHLVYREHAHPPEPFDGHHVQVTLADFSGPYGRLRERGLVSQEDGPAQYRFIDVVDLDDGRVLARIEHEVRSMRHPMFGRPLVNRDPSVTAARYLPGREALAWSLARG